MINAHLAGLFSQKIHAAFDGIRKDLKLISIDLSTIRYSATNLHFRVKATSERLISKQTTDDFRRRTEASLDDISRELEIDYTNIGTIRYLKGTFSCGIKAQIFPMDDKGRKLNKDQADWNAYCWKYGFKKTEYQAHFYNNGKEYKTLTIDPKRPKYPIICLDLQFEERICFTDSAVKRALAEKTQQSRKRQNPDSGNSEEPSKRQNLSSAPEDQVKKTLGLMFNNLPPETMEKITQLIAAAQSVATTN